MFRNLVIDTLRRDPGTYQVMENSERENAREKEITSNIVDLFSNQSRMASCVPQKFLYTFEEDYSHECIENFGTWSLATRQNEKGRHEGISSVHW